MITFPRTFSHYTWLFPNHFAIPTFQDFPFQDFPGEWSPCPRSVTLWLLFCNAPLVFIWQCTTSIPSYCYYSVLTRRPASANRTAHRLFQATDQPVSQMQASDAITLRLPCYEAKCVQRRCFQWGRSLCIQISREQLTYWYHLKGNWLRYNFAAESFYIMKLCSRLFVLYCRNWLKDDKFRYLIPILRKLMARWKPRERLPIRRNWTFFR